jgi:alanyl-tRNA synthetase
MTKRLFWAKPYQKTFTGKVLGVKKGAIILDKTLFYATAGNQIHDTGIITINEKSYRVINVEKDDNNTFFHYTDPKPAKELVGMTVKGKVDWERRYSVMKAHTSQHIVSAVMMKQFINKTLHANIKPGEFSIEFEQKITRTQLQSVMQESNRIFTIGNKKVTSHVLDHDNASKKYSKKIRGMIPNVEEVRILEVSDVDFNTCGGTHIKNTSEIGIVSISKIHRDCEVDFNCGEKAIDVLSSSNVDIVYSQKLLNCSLDEYPDIFQRRIQELQDLHKKRKDLSSLIMELIQFSPFQEINGIKARFLDVDLPKKTVFNGFKKFEPENILIVTKSPIQYLILSSSKNFPAKLIVEKLKKVHGGKGGGSLLNAQILFEHEPKNIQEDIIQILKHS